MSSPPVAAEAHSTVAGTSVMHAAMSMAAALSNHSAQALFGRQDPR